MSSGEILFKITGKITSQISEFRISLFEIQMGLVELIKFALISISFLAWPVIALGYLFFASIRAVESGSKYHLRKLVTYWIPFALISLFEFAFLKIIPWIPLWTRMRLVSFFDGACHAYQSLVRPVLFGDVQAVMDKLHKLKEEKPRKRETFADVAEECIKANACGASEKAITSKHECKECNDSQGDAQVLEPEEKIAEDLSKQAKIAAWVTKVTKAAAASEVKEMTQQESNAKSRHPDAPPLNKPQQQMEWSCDLCKMTTTDEKTLNAHLQGRKHKSNCESLKAIKLRAENTGPSLSTIGKLDPSNVEMDAAAGKVKKTAPLKASAENSPPETPPSKKVDQEWKCYLCKVKTSSEKMLNEHLHGIEHKLKWECLKASEQIAKYTGSSPLTTSELCWSNMGFTTYVREATHIEANGENCCLENPSVKKVQQEWACDLCKARTSSEKTLNDHLQGSKHKFRCESLKANELDANDTGHSPLATGKLNKGNVEFGAISKEMTPTEASAENSHPKTAPTKKVQQEWKCKVKTTSEKLLNDHLQGSRHKISCESLKVGEFIAKDTRPSPSAACKLNQENADFGTCAKEKTPTEASAENSRPETPPTKKIQLEWTCDYCNVKTTSEKMLNDHLQGKKHKSHCEFLKASDLSAKERGPYHQQ